MATDENWAIEVQERAPGIWQKFASQIGQGDIVLETPACPKGCDDCRRECAVRYIAADWWSRELVAFATNEASVMRHNGVTYDSSSFCGRA